MPDVAHLAATVIVNPRAGRQGGEGLVAELRRRLGAQGRAVQVAETGHPGHGVALAAAAARAGRWIIVVGGDGTLREVATGLLEAPRHEALALIPLGNANVLARELGIPLEPGRALDLLDHSTDVAVDVGRANGEVFLSMVGVGYDARVSRWVHRARRLPLARSVYRSNGDLVYVALGLAACLRVRPPRVQLRADGEERASGPDLIVCNTRVYAKGWSVAPDADCGDGALDFVVRRHAAALHVLRALLAARRKQRLPDRLATYGRGRQLSVHSERAFAYHLDGDPREKTNRIDMELVPHHLQVRVPAKTREGGDGNRV